MKQCLLTITLMGFYFLTNAQTMKDVNLRLMEDKVAIKELVDKFSILADVKDVDNQVLLFTENARVETSIDGQVVASMTGRKQIGETFSNFLNLFQTVYHINGQQTVDINGDNAVGISYCAVTLIGLENGKKMKTSMGVYYNDEYVRENGHWLIAKRKSTFAWQDKQEIK